VTFFNNLKGFDDIMPGGTINYQFGRFLFYLTEGTQVVTLHQLMEAAHFLHVRTHVSVPDAATWQAAGHDLMMYYYTCTSEVKKWTCTSCTHEMEFVGHLGDETLFLLGVSATEAYEVAKERDLSPDMFMDKDTSACSYCGKGRLVRRLEGRGVGAGRRGAGAGVGRR
jgi:hypothetical protein